jgi:hypothetical protein
MLEQRIREKFGAGVLETVLQVTHRKVDDDGVELSPADRKADYLERLAQASDRARWVCAADKLHNAATILADVGRTVDPESVWGRFKAGREGTVRWYRDVYERLRSLGFDAPIMGELAGIVAQLEDVARP